MWSIQRPFSFKEQIVGGELAGATNAFSHSSADVVQKLVSRNVTDHTGDEIVKPGKLLSTILIHTLIVLTLVTILWL